MDGETVLAAATDVASVEFGEDLVAAYTIGSLAHGGFVPAVSDVDLALVLRTTGPGTAEQVVYVVTAARALAPGTLADRLSVFWADPDTVRRGPRHRPHRLPPVDRLDLLDSGVLRRGTDVRDGAVRPTPDELVAGSAAFLAGRVDGPWVADVADPSALPCRGVRTLTKTVLFPVRFLHTLRTGRIGRNDDAVASYTGPHRELAGAALAWRSGEPVAPGPARALLAAHLAGLYRECVEAHLAVLPPDNPSRPALERLRQMFART